MSEMKRWRIWKATGAPWDVTAEELRVEHGCLVFLTGGVVVNAYAAAGGWTEVELISEKQAEVDPT